MKKILLGLSLIFSLLFVHAQTLGLEDIIVEKYYVSDAADEANVDGGVLPAGSITYRIYVDLKPWWYLNGVYGDGGSNQWLKISSTTGFFNNIDGSLLAENNSATLLKSNTLGLDSYLTMGAAAKSRLGVLKQYDNNGNAIAGSLNNDGLLANTVGYSIPLTTADGMITGTQAAATTVLGIDGAELALFDAENSVVPGELRLGDGTWSVLGGTRGVDPGGRNQILIGQFTVLAGGEFSFELNLSISDSTRDLSQNFLARNPKAGEYQSNLLIYPAPVSNIAPTVSITAPANGATVTTGSTVAIVASASDVDGTIASTVYKLNGTTLASANFTAVVGANVIEVIVTDDKGATASDTITVDGLTPNIAPTITITAPQQNDQFTRLDQNIVFSADATDADGTVVTVEFFVNDEKVNTLSASPYLYSWLINDQLGDFNAYAVAIDDDGLTDTSEVIHFSVSNINPVVDIVGIPNDTIIISQLPDFVVFTAEASDEDGEVDSVVFYINDVITKTVTESPYTYMHTINEDSTSLTIKAIVYDNNHGTDTVEKKVFIYFSTTIQPTQQNQGKLKIYPSLVSEMMTIELSGVESSNDVLCAIYNCLGGVVMQKELDNNLGNVQERINVSHLEQGIYFVEVKTGKNKYYQKMIKN